MKKKKGEYKEGKLNEELELMLKSIKFNNPGISDEILEAFRICDRKFFVRGKGIGVYDDVPQHVAHGQTISQPSTIARMIRLLNLDKGLDVLEVGANTGYHASLVAYLVYPGNVTTIEIFPDLVKMARRNVALLKKSKRVKMNIEIFAGDALDKTQNIWQHKYDRIYFTAGVEQDKIDEVKAMGRELLRENGLLLYPTREAWDWGALEIWQLHGQKLRLVSRETGYAFVPLLRKQELKDFYEKKKK
ncbi:MAG: protein-L-isoaspartate O-methyltransferase family protein [Candidatus Pacearchaeota archaeon]